MQALGRVLTISGTVLVAAAGVLAAVTTYVDKGAADRHHVSVVIEKGDVCASLRDPRYEVSCGTTAFGDVRYNCPSGRKGDCPRTTTVTLRNVSQSPVVVTMVSGRREGERNFLRAPELAPGRTVTLRPRPDEKYVFDILLRSVKSGVGVVKIVQIG
ncbi:hypothetical protein [Streptomyces sp. NPDC007856]|uniref:hypothetical protein n=1 Tax=Streptomyces sp. NPDC007856 TaxID=3364781 RepID=UPI0036BC9C1A